MVMNRNSSFKEAEGKIFWMDACCKLSMTDADWWRFLWRQGKTRNSLGRLCHVCGCFILTARWKDGLFLQLSPWWNPRLRHVACSFGTSRKKHQPFSMIQPKEYENFSYLFVISMWYSHPHKYNSDFYCPWYRNATPLRRQARRVWWMRRLRLL